MVISLRGVSTGTHEFINAPPVLIEPTTLDYDPVTDRVFGIGLNTTAVARTVQFAGGGMGTSRTWIPATS